MKKLLFFLVASLALVSCGNAAKEEVKTEVAAVDSAVAVEAVAVEAVAADSAAAVEAPAAH